VVSGVGFRYWLPAAIHCTASARAVKRRTANQSPAARLRQMICEFVKLRVETAGLLA
jgi:hypothetical protein